ncbi:MAG TPA: DUF4249 domain-containing protein [Chitinophaga sp.]|uniref:DUF4249 domain-containing protein n=1 Tax=Chitinophaga sp. TaxID=1869181 RepID=UPI002B8BE47C|nr:DUF4249 domain-containing protein [Chitinophaga sp.]HVI49401.1 DUF4249 domain-containing protein [Chitinophaga sp.]
MKRIFVYTLLLAGVFSSCEKRVNISLPYEGDRIVVNSLIQPDSVMYVRITRSVPVSVYDDSGFEEIPNAAVTLEENGTMLASLKQQRILGRTYFVSTEKAMRGRKYDIRVSVPGMTPVSGSDTLPCAPIIGNASAQRGGSRIQFMLTDPPGSTDYYRIRVFTYGPTHQPDTIRQFQLDPTFNNNIEDVLSSYNNTFLVMQDTRFNGKQVNFVLEAKDPLIDTDQVMIEVSALTYDSYRYFKTIASQQRTATGLITEPIRVFTNINAGYGIFAGINTKRLVFTLE